MKVYTQKQWTKDRIFNAQEGQEVEKSIYYEMMDCIPPKTLPRHKVDEFNKNYNICVFSGFLMGEPHGFNGSFTYLAFGSVDNKYYYMGESTQ